MRIKPFQVLIFIIVAPVFSIFLLESILIPSDLMSAKGDHQIFIYYVAF